VTARTTILLLPLVGLLAVACAGCGAGEPASGSGAKLAGESGSPAGEGRLLARPGRVARASSWRGRHELAGGALLYVPASYRPARAGAFVLALHGAGSGPGGFVGLGALAEQAGLIVLAPKSRKGTWDLARGGFGADVASIDRLLRLVFARFAIDPRRVFVWGFSDGASYALSLGLANGDLFDGIVALSPGFAGPAELRGRPRVFVGHGTRDTVLPIDRTSRPLVRRLREDGYPVTFRTFDGPHTLWLPLARQAVSWLGRSG
jgi:phospholipase/carboxylesterase